MNRRSWVELVVLSALWGAVYPLIVVGLRDLSPELVVLARVLLAAVLLVPLAIHRDALRTLWRQPRAIIETVLIQSTIPLVLLTYGQQYISAGLAGILVGAQPLFVAQLAFRYDPGERPQGWRAAVGIALGPTLGVATSAMLVTTAVMAIPATVTRRHGRRAQPQPQP